MNPVGLREDNTYQFSLGGRIQKDVTIETAFKSLKIVLLRKSESCTGRSRREETLWLKFAVTTLPFKVQHRFRILKILEFLCNTLKLSLTFIFCRDLQTLPFVQFHKIIDEI